MVKVFNYFFKINNLDFFTFRLKVAAALFFIFFMLVSTNSVFALGWGDEEWVEAGCPSDILGTWVSSGLDIDSQKLLNIYQDKIIFLSNQHFEEKYSYNPKNTLRSNTHVGLNLQPV